MGDLRELEEAFKLLDSDNDGMISPEEARKFFKDSDERTRSELEAVIKNCDKDGNGSLDAAEFRSMWEFLRGDGEELREIREDFERLDKDKNGYICKEEMMAMLGDMNHFQGDKEKEAVRCISEMDADGDGKVNFPEFLLAWKYKFT